jgi:hypothetical protein
MDIPGVIILVGSAFLLLHGVTTLIIAWAAPALLERSFVQSALVGGHLAPTRTNCTLVAICSVLMAAFAILLSEHQVVIGLIAFAGWALIRFVYLRQSSGARA